MKIREEIVLTVALIFFWVGRVFLAAPLRKQVVRRRPSPSRSRARLLTSDASSLSTDR